MTSAMVVCWWHSSQREFDAPCSRSRCDIGSEWQWWDARKLIRFSITRVQQSEVIDIPCLIIDDDVKREESQHSPFIGVFVTID
jgi:hypothetical protein